MKRKITMLLVAAVTLSLFSSCDTKEPDNKDINEALNLSEKVTLNICGPWTSCKAIETASQAFYEKYPNCTVEYEYVQNYQDSLVTRMRDKPDSVDIFLTENIQSDSPFLPYAEELLSHNELDLSDTNDALIKNFSYISTDTTTPTKLYAVPLGGDMRGLYVNKTLLSSVGLEVPKNADELLHCCQVLKDAGYIPMNGNPGMFGQRLLYPYVADLIVHSDNYEETYNRVNKNEAGISELFRKPMELLYTLADKGYYNYKYVETELKMFTDNSDEGCARYFFNVVAPEGGEFAKVDDKGTVAFTTGTMSQLTTMAKIKDDYHSQIEYEFIMAPVSDKGGFAYVSPSKGIAVNSGSAHKDWAIEFLNFLFGEKVNTQFASDINYIPNTKNSFDVINNLFDIPDDRISDLGQVTFDYSFYNVINAALVTTSKCNNPKYMDTDADGNSVMYPFEYYMEQLESEFASCRAEGADTQ